MVDMITSTLVTRLHHNQHHHHHHHQHPKSPIGSTPTHEGMQTTIEHHINSSSNYNAEEATKVNQQVVLPPLPPLPPPPSSSSSSSSSPLPPLPLPTASNADDASKTTPAAIATKNTVIYSPRRQSLEQGLEHLPD
jgi:hypothetical protein